MPMLKRSIFLSLAAVLAFSLVACDSGNSLRGSTEVELDLRVSNLSADAADFSPAFDPDQTGLYTFEVTNDVESVVFTVGAPLDDNAEILAFRQSTASDQNRLVITQEQNVTSGTPVTFTLDVGDNLFVFRSHNGDQTQLLEYKVVVHRLSSEARILSVAIDDFTPQDDGQLILTFDDPENFDPDITTYQITAPFSLCTVGIQPGISTDASLMINGNAAVTDDFTYIDLVEGLNVIEALVVSEDESESRLYTFNITRSPPTDSEMDSVNSLAALSLDSGRLASGNVDGFRCLIASYTARVNSSAANVELSAIPVIAGRTVRVGNIVENEEDTTLSLENLVDVPAGGSANLAVETGSDNIFGISLNETDDGTPIIHYTIAITRSETEWIEVETGAELQAALQNAQPNQEIVLLSDNYSAEASLAASGKEGVHFYTNASGTAETPIILRSAGAVSVLEGSALDQNTVLELEGSHWDISRLELSNAAKGLVLNSADNNVINTLIITDVGQRGFELINGSDNNNFARVFVLDIGSEAGAGEDLGEAMVIGSDDEQWIGAPTPGPYEASNSDNIFSNLILGPNVQGELIDVKEGSERNIVQYSTLDSRDISEAAELDSAVVIKGNDTQFSYNTLIHSGDAVLNAAISVVDGRAAWNTQEWAQGTLIFDNIFDFDGAGIDLVSASAEVGAVQVDDNVRDDGGAESFVGGAIDQSYVSPLYQIQLASDASKCLQIENVDFLEVTIDSEGNIVVADDPALLRTSELVLAVDCANVTSQHWDIINDRGATTLLRSAANIEDKIAPQDGGNFTSSQGTGLVVPFEDLGSGLDESFFLRWTINGYSERQVYFLNRFNPSWAMTMDNLGVSADTESDAAFVRINALAEEQRFRLVPVE